MHRIATVIIIAFFASQIQLSLSSKHQANLHLCERGRTVSVEINMKLKKNNATCDCQASPISRTTAAGHDIIRDDYVRTPGVGFHKLHTEAQTWNDARHICEAEGAHLAIINSRAEEEAILSIFRQNASSITDGFNTEEVFLGIHDFYKEGEWVTILGEALEATGFARWSNDHWGQQPDNKHRNQHCGALLWKGGMDDVHCHEKLGFVCELPVGCAN